MASVRTLFRDRPIIPLIVLLGLLVVVMQLASPGIVKFSWERVILQSAEPLAILAGCQT
jgi:ribose transport system permease protein